MKALFTVLILSAGIFSNSSFAAEGCFLKDYPSTIVSDRSIPNQKRLWNACIDSELAKLERQNPNFSFEDGQAVGDNCTTSQIVCENI